MIDFVIIGFGILVIIALLPFVPIPKLSLNKKTESEYDKIVRKISIGTPIILPPDCKFLESGSLNKIPVRPMVRRFKDNE